MGVHLMLSGASWGGFTTAQYLSQGGDFFGKIVVQYLAYFLGLYFAIGVFLDLFLLGATAFAGVNYSTNAEAFLKAVKQVWAGCRPYFNTCSELTLLKCGFPIIFAWCLLHTTAITT